MIRRYKRYKNLKSVSSHMKNKSIMERAAAMCGPEGEQSPICFLPDSSQPDTERWQTLLTISINTKNAILKHAAGNLLINYLKPVIFLSDKKIY